MDVIRIETRCNQHCIFCGADPKNEGDYTLDLRELAEKIRAAGPQEIVEISGGEPTLSPLLPKVLAIAKRLEKRISLQTNGMRFADARFAKALAQAGLTHAFVSLHGPDAASADAITRTPGAFDLTVAGIHNLMQARVHVSLNYVISRPNRTRMLDYVRFVAQTFGSGMTVVFSFINPFHNAWEHPKLIPLISEIIGPLREAMLEGERLGLVMHLPDICGIPICFMAGMERFADKYADIQNGWPFSPHPQKTKAAVCESCVWTDQCDGLWERYAQLHGTDELKPVLQKPAMEAISAPERSACLTHDAPNTSGRVRDTALLVGSTCPNNCLFCNEGGGATPRKVMSLAEAEKLLKTTHAEWVFLSGGEPTTCRNLADYANLARACGAKKITLVSNGSGLAERRFAESIVEAGVNEIRLSIHGPDAALHDKLTRRPGSFASISAAIDNLNRIKQNAALETVALVVVNRLNMSVLMQLVQKLIGWRFDKIGLGIVEPTRNARENFDEMIPRYADVAAVIEDLFDVLGPDIENAGIQMFADNLPYCLLENPNVSLGERSVIHTIDGRDGQVMEMKPQRDKIYGPPCHGCPQRGACEGVFEAYVARFGWSEFGPR